MRLEKIMSKRRGKENANDATKLLERFDPCNVVAAAGKDEALLGRLLHFADSLKKQVETADASRRKIERARAFLSGRCDYCDKVEKDKEYVHTCECFTATRGEEGVQMCYFCYDNGRDSWEDEGQAECGSCGVLSCGGPRCPEFVQCHNKYHDAGTQQCDEEARCKDCTEEPSDWVSCACGAARWCSGCADTDEMPRCVVCEKRLCGDVGQMARDGAAELHHGGDECKHAFCDECEEPVCPDCQTERRYGGRTLQLCEPCGSYYEEF